MARTPTRTRKVLLAVTLALLAVVLAAWGVSYWLEFGLIRTVPCTYTRSTAKGWLSTARGAYHQFYLGNGSGVLTFNWNTAVLDPAPSKDDSFVLGPVAWSYAYSFGGSPLRTTPSLILSLRPECTEVLGVRVWHVAPAQGGLRGVDASHWTLAALLAALAGWLWYPMYKYSKLPKEGHCPKCGYDFRGLAPDASCPECGEGPAPTPPAAGGVFVGAVISGTIQPMAGGPSLIRRTLLAATLALLGVVLLSWALSYWRHTELYRIEAQPGLPTMAIFHGCNLRNQSSAVSCTNASGALWLHYSSPDEVYSSSEIPGIDDPQYVWKIDVQPPSRTARDYPGLFAAQWPARVEVLGFGFGSSSSMNWSSYSLVVPYRSSALLTGGAAFWLWYPQRKSVRRRANNECIKCGYDRKGLAPAASCPECSEVPAPARSSPPTP